MDPILQVLLSWQFVLFGLAIAAIIYVFRLVVQYVASLLKKDLSKSNLWDNLILPVAPIVVGVVAALLLKKFPYPGFTADAHGVVMRGDRIIFGLVTGLFSTVMYRMVKSMLYQKLQDVVQNLKLPTGNSTAANDQVTSDQLPPKGQL